MIWTHLSWNLDIIQTQHDPNQILLHSWHSITLQDLFLQVFLLFLSKHIASPLSMSASSKSLATTRCTLIFHYKFTKSVEYIYLISKCNPHTWNICLVNVIPFWASQEIFVTKPMQLQERSKRNDMYKMKFLPWAPFTDLLCKRDSNNWEEWKRIKKQSWLPRRPLKEVSQCLKTIPQSFFKSTLWASPEYITKNLASPATLIFKILFYLFWMIR